MSHIIDMIKRFEQNRYWQEKRREVKVKHEIKAPHLSLSYKKVAPEELIRLKKQIRKEARNERLGSFLWSAIVTAILMIIMSRWLWSLF